MGLASTFLGEATGTETDEMLGLSAASAAAASAAAYLQASLQACTPEVRRLYADYLTQTMVGHQALTELIVKKGWVNPYDSPEHQLGAAYHESEAVIQKGE